MTQSQLEQYFERIGYTPSDEPAEEILRNIHFMQATHIPFENLDVYKGLGISLKPDDLFNKLVVRRRGGYCFELNAMLAMALRAVGFSVKRVSARLARTGTDFGGYAHCAAIVDAGSARYIADVGYGGGGFVEPLKLEPDIVQHVQCGTYKVIKDEKLGYVVQWEIDGEFRSYMAVHDVEANDQDFEIGNYFTSTHPESGFRKMIMCALPNSNGRVSVTNEGVRITEKDKVMQIPLGGSEAFREAFRNYLGVEIEWQPAAERIFGA